MADAAFHRGRQGPGLIVPADEDQHFPGIRHRPHPHAEGLGGHLLRVAPEEAGVDDPRVCGQVPNAGAGSEGGIGLVEGDVAVHADAAHEEVDAPVGGDLFLIAAALPFRVVGHAVEDVDVLFLHVYQVVEEIVMHEVPIALVMLVGQAQVFIHVEGDHVGEGDFSGFVHPNELLVDPYGAGTRGQAQDEGARLLVATNLGGDIGCRPCAHLVVIILNDDSHGHTPMLS